MLRRHFDERRHCYAFAGGCCQIIALFAAIRLHDIERMLRVC